MKARPILMAPDIMRAILREIEQPGTGKTQTRRVIKIGKTQPEDHPWNAYKDDPSVYYSFSADFQEGCGVFSHCVRKNGEDLRCSHRKIHCPYGKPGDLIWLKEPWESIWLKEPCESWKNVIYYQISTNQRKDYTGQRCLLLYDEGVTLRWKPDTSMPRCASRITLEITDIRVERLQDISVEDAIAEGVEKTALPLEFAGITPDYQADERTDFAILWNRINKERGYGWDTNPWVWVIEFTPHLMNVDDFIKEKQS